jgi:hypothetical protein
MNENLKAALRTVGTHHENVKQDMSHWLNYELFTWNWWILVTLIVFSMIFWVIFVDRKRLLEILLVGTLVGIPTSYLDAIGIDLKFWVYPVQFVPITPRAIPFDIFVVPVAVMFLYQYFNKWKSYITGIFFMALTFSFIGEPLSHALNLVYYIKWNYYYSFLYYLVLGTSVKAIVTKVKDIYIKD